MIANETNKLENSFGTYIDSIRFVRYASESEFRGVTCVDPCRREIAARTDAHLCPPRRKRSAKRFSRYFGQYLAD